MTVRETFHVEHHRTQIAVRSTPTELERLHDVVTGPFDLEVLHIHAASCRYVKVLILNPPLVDEFGIGRDPRC